MRTAGFSLVELLVVIAIIGLLATAGYVGYKYYVIKSIVAKAMYASQSIIDKELDYYQKNGEFGNRVDLGYPPQVGNGGCSNCTALDIFGEDLEPYLQTVEIIDDEFSYCTQSANVHVRFNTTLTGTSFFLRQYFYNIDGIIYHDCALPGNPGFTYGNCYTNINFINTRRDAACP